MRLTKYQQITLWYTTCCAANVYKFVYILIGAPIVPLNKENPEAMLLGNSNLSLNQYGISVQKGNIIILGIQISKNLLDRKYKFWLKINTDKKCLKYVQKLVIY